MTDSLAASCAELAAWLPAAAALTARPDTDGTAGSGQPGSAPPWNTPAAYALTDAAEGLRRLEASMRRDVTGRTGRRRGGSGANTMAALKAIETLAYGLPERHVYEYDEKGRQKPCQCPHCRAARIVGRWSRKIRELPAVDDAEPWRRVSATCPYCGLGMLRVQARSGRVACLRGGACLDGDGRPPVGHLDVSPLTGDPQVRWNDGLVAP
jgi:hypothetical protein